METLQHEHASSEQASTVAAAAKCLHAECSCTVLTGEQYCSDYCARSAEVEHSKDDDHECSCGHLECTHAAAMTPLVPPLVAPLAS